MRQSEGDNSASPSLLKEVKLVFPLWRAECGGNLKGEGAEGHIKDFLLFSTLSGNLQHPKIK